MVSNGMGEDWLPVSLVNSIKNAHALKCRLLHGLQGGVGPSIFLS